MKVFLSHSFEARAAFDNIAWAFQNAGIEYWNPADVQAGTPLSDQLRDAIANSVLCVFIATVRSVSSAWCGAELGAFCGAGKKVFVYLADPDLAESELPRQFLGHFHEQRIPRLVEHVKASLKLEPPMKVWHTEWRLGRNIYRERLELHVLKDHRIVGSSRRGALPA